MKHALLYDFKNFFNSQSKETRDNFLSFINKNKFGVINRDDLKLTIIYILEQQYLPLIELIEVDSSHIGVVVYGNIPNDLPDTVGKYTTVSLNTSKNKRISNNVKIIIDRPVNTHSMYTLVNNTKDKDTICRFGNELRTITFKYVNTTYENDDVEIPHNIRSCILNYIKTGIYTRPESKPLKELTESQLRDFISISKLDRDLIQILEYLVEVNINPNILLRYIEYAKEKLNLLKSTNKMSKSLVYLNNSSLLMIVGDNNESVDEINIYIEYILREGNKYQQIDMLVISNEKLKIDINTLKLKLHPFAYTVNIGIIDTKKLLTLPNETGWSFEVLHTDSFSVKLDYIPSGNHIGNVSPFIYNFYREPSINGNIISLYNNLENTSMKLTIETIRRGEKLW